MAWRRPRGKVYRQKPTTALNVVKPIEKRKVSLLIVCGFSFVIGNVTWPLFGDPRVFYVPLALFLFFMLWQISEPGEKTVLQEYCIRYFKILSISNVFKQIFYNEHIDQINDYVVGSVVTIILLIFVIKWVIRNRKNGGKA
jgi:hypothetical protein